MRFPPPRAPAPLSILALLTLACGLCACATPTPAILVATPCSALAPPELTAPTPGADLPADDTQGEWIKFADRQTGQLDKANLTKAGALEVIRRCEARDQETAKALKGRPWWRVWG